MLIETQVGKTKETSEKLQKIKGVVKTNMTTGPYNIIAVIEAKDQTTLCDIITRGINPNHSLISRTVTCLIIPEE